MPSLGKHRQYGIGGHDRRDDEDERGTGLSIPHLGLPLPTVPRKTTKNIQARWPVVKPIEAHLLASSAKYWPLTSQTTFGNQWQQHAFTQTTVDVSPTHANGLIVGHRAITPVLPSDALSKNPKVSPSSSQSLELMPPEPTILGLEFTTFVPVFAMSLSSCFCLWAVFGCCCFNSFRNRAKKKAAKTAKDPPLPLDRPSQQQEDTSSGIGGGRTSNYNAGRSGHSRHRSLQLVSCTQLCTTISEDRSKRGLQTKQQRSGVNEEEELYYPPTNHAGHTLFFGPQSPALSDGCPMSPDPLLPGGSSPTGGTPVWKHFVGALPCLTHLCILNYADSEVW